MFALLKGFELKNETKALKGEGWEDVKIKLLFLSISLALLMALLPHKIYTTFFVCFDNSEIIKSVYFSQFK